MGKGRKGGLSTRDSSAANPQPAHLVGAVPNAFPHLPFPPVKQKKKKKDRGLCRVPLGHAIARRKQLVTGCFEGLSLVS